MVVQSAETLLRASTTEQLRLLRSRVLSSVELLQATFAQLDSLNPHLNAVVTERRDEALAEAGAADRALAAGRARPLEGVPFTVKDLLATAGLRTTAGSRVLADYVPPVSATAVRRLQDAGAILLGKTNCSEFGMGNLHTGNRVFGDTRNPWSDTRTPGGSSGGDSAAVAAGLTSFGIGTDYGGSVRWPAHCTGVAALRPTPGLIPNTGVLPHSGVDDRLAVNSSSFQCWIQTIGPLARGAADLALLTNVMRGPDGFDSHVAEVDFVAPNHVEVRGLACVWFAGDATLPVRADVAAAVADAAEALRSYGLRVQAARPDGFPEAAATYEAVRAADGLSDHARVVGNRVSELTPLVRQGVLGGRDERVSLADYRRLVERADRVRSQIAAFMQRWPILLLPVGSEPAFEPELAEFDGEWPTASRSAIETCCRVVSLLRAPAAVVPCGTSDEGLPIGVQIVGRPHHDAEVLAVAQVLEAVFGAWQPRARRARTDGR